MIKFIIKKLVLCLFMGITLCFQSDKLVTKKNHFIFAPFFFFFCTSFPACISRLSSGYWVIELFRVYVYVVIPRTVNCVQVFPTEIK